MKRDYALLISYILAHPEWHFSIESDFAQKCEYKAYKLYDLYKPFFPEFVQRRGREWVKEHAEVLKYENKKL